MKINHRGPNSAFSHVCKLALAIQLIVKGCKIYSLCYYFSINYLWSDCCCFYCSSTWFMTFLQGIFPIRLSIRTIADFYFFYKASASRAAQIHTCSLARLTPKEISFHGQITFTTWLNHYSSLRLQDTLHAHICQRSPHKQWRRRKFQEALPKQVSTLTIETTSASPCSCRPSCKPAMALPIKSAPRESWKAACRCAFLPAPLSPLPLMFH